MHCSEFQWKDHLEILRPLGVLVLEEEGSSHGGCLYRFLGLAQELHQEREQMRKHIVEQNRCSQVGSQVCLFGWRSQICTCSVNPPKRVCSRCRKGKLANMGISYAFSTLTRFREVGFSS